MVNVVSHQSTASFSFVDDGLPVEAADSEPWNEGEVSHDRLGEHFIFQLILVHGEIIAGIKSLFVSEQNW